MDAIRVNGKVKGHYPDGCFYRGCRLGGRVVILDKPIEAADWEEYRKAGFTVKKTDTRYTVQPPAGYEFDVAAWAYDEATQAYYDLGKLLPPPRGPEHTRPIW